MKRTCFVFNIAPQYVKASYILFDKEFDTRWCFGSNDTNIKEMDHSLLKDVKVYPTIRHFKSYRLKGISEVAKDKNIGTYILLGEPGCLSMWALPFLIRRHNSSAKIFFWSHGWYGKESKLKVLIKKFFFTKADGVLLYGNYAKNLMIKEGFNKDSLFTIHNCLDYDYQVCLRNKLQPSNIYKDHFGNNYPILIFIGRLTPVKQLDMIIDAVSLLDRKGQQFNVVYVGDGSERERLEKKVYESGLENRVWFYGECYDDKENAELIFNADICVAPGNIGLTSMHSLVFGTPVITHNDFKWQMPEFEAIIPNETGIFFKRNDVGDLALKIEEWYNVKKDKRDEVRLACYKEIDENWTPQFELNVLKKIIQ